MNNRKIIEDCYRTHRGELLAFVSARLHNSTEAEDLVHEAFLRLLTGNRPISEVTLPHLIFTLCRNLVVDWYRHHKIKTDSEHELIHSYGHCDSAETLLSMREVSEQLERGLAHVPEECRELYRMHIYGNMPVRDISQLSGQPYKTVEYRLGLARKQVRNYLKHIS